MKHYRLVERFYVLIFNREILSFLCIGVAISLLFCITFTVLSLKLKGLSPIQYRTQPFE
ncbi:ABC transporter six-transmembrane domain-containing protein [Gallibacterium genomosp. 3]|uniref:ABC transporter six-transmembrane domain-containing protein n=1 Tax=Gallibacterium genomosp. 3 TaxID=505345 RepID=UPI0022B24D89|nr:ABC transporter six-transmembrane domain-containing protein [Gallibacterium genomosp. 3]